MAGPRERKRPTLAAVAERSAVSIKTASRVLNGEKYVAVDTAERVLAAAEDLGFRPNAVARSLRQGSSTGTIGVLLACMGDSVGPALLDSLDSRLAAAGWTMVARVTADTDAVRAFIDDCDVLQIHTLLLGPGVDLDGIEARILDRFTLVGLGPRSRGSFPAVTMDHRRAGRMAVSQLAQRGHMAIGVIGDRAASSVHSERLAGVAEGMAEAGIAGWQEYVREDAHDHRTAKNIAAAMLGGPLRPSALITLTSVVTGGALSACHRLDRWPALVGIDDFPLSDVLDITTVACDLDFLAQEAVRLLGVPEGPPPEPMEAPIVVACELVERGSGEETPQAPLGIVDKPRTKV